MVNKDRLQAHYDKLISYADFNFNQSTNFRRRALQSEYLAKAEAFEAAADLLYGDFPDYIITKTTLRFNSIREHHLQEENTDEPKVKHD